MQKSIKSVPTDSQGKSTVGNIFDPRDEGCLPVLFPRLMLLLMILFLPLQFGMMIYELFTG